MFDNISRRLLSTLVLGATALLITAGCVEQEPQVHVGSVDDSSPRVEGQDHYELVPTSDTEYESDLDAMVPVGVKVLDYAGEPASGETVEFEVVSSTEDPLVGLDAGSVISGEQGEASNRLRVGESTGNITVRATHSEAESPVEFRVDVTSTPPGHLEVSAQYEQAELMELSGVDFHVWESRQIECNYIAPYVLPSTPFAEEANVAAPGESSLIENLQTEQTYTVTATGLGPEGQISAHGCVDGVDIESEATTETAIPIELLDLTPTGNYKALSQWDFTEALAASGPLGQTIADAIGWVSDPAGMAAEYMVDIAVEWVCDEYGYASWQCGAAYAAKVEGSAEDEIADFLEDALTSIPGVEDLLEIGDELTNIVESPTIESILTIDNKASGEGELRGIDAWQAIIFEWTRGCDENSDPDCGEIRIGLGDDIDIGVLQDEWEGRLEDYDQLVIDRHDMVFPYGEFIVYLLQNELLPAITGNDDTTSLADAFDELLCSNLGGIDIWGIEFDEQTVQGFCDTVFSTAGFIGESYLSNLEFDVNLRISGDGRMIDTSSDGRVDLIDEAFFYGEIESEEGESTEMEAAFTAERIE